MTRNEVRERMIAVRETKIPWETTTEDGMFELTVSYEEGYFEDSEGCWIITLEGDEPVYADTLEQAIQEFYNLWYTP